MTLTQVNTITPHFSVGNKPSLDGSVRLHSKITRKGEIQTQAGKICSYGDGTGETVTPKPPDCGTKTTDSIRLDLGYYYRQANLLQLQRRTGNKDLFENCAKG